MPTFSTQFPALRVSGPTIELQIAVSRALYNSLIKRKEPVPDPVKVLAMIDTGAQTTVVNSNIIKKLNLQPTSKVPVSSPLAHNVEVAQYTAAIILPKGVIIETTEMVEVPLEGASVHCLIGRDILRHGVFIYNGVYQTMSFTI
jgi:hypothetical protein